MIKKGFVDLQVNGYLGKSFSSDKLTIEDVKFVTRELLKRGTIAYCPTVVTSPMKVYRHALPLLAKAMEMPELAPHLLGIHIEGPFISPLDGPRGAHPRAYVILPDVAVYREFQDLAKGKIALVTLAPEIKGAMKLIEYIVKEGKAIVSMGHHYADKDTIKKACDSGAKVCTHLGNGITRIIDRHINPLWAQLAEDRLTGMLITDGFHIPPEFIEVALRVKGVKRSVITSDCVQHAGLKPGEYVDSKEKIVVEKNGRIGMKNTAYLAGSGKNMLECMNFLASLNLLNEEDLWQVGYANPLNLINRKLQPNKYKTLPNIIFKDRKFTLNS